MQKAIEFFNDQISNIRYADIGTSLIDSIRVDVNNQKIPIKQLGWTTLEKRRIFITAYDASTLGSINKSLSNEGFSSYIFSKGQIVVDIPIRSGEDKERVIKQINKLAEEARVSIRNIRKKFRDEANIQELTDASIAKINSLTKCKIDSFERN